MSAKAYRVIKIEHAKEDTFNLWHDDKLVEFFDNEYGLYDKLSEGMGLAELPVKALERALVEVPMDEELKESLRKDIGVCKAENEDYVQYYCF